MNSKCYPVDFFLFCGAANLIFTLTHIPYLSQCWQACFRHTDVKEGGMLLSSYGSGESIECAIENYIEQIQGKTLVINAMSKEHRREIIVPFHITIKDRI